MGIKDFSDQQLAGQRLMVGFDGTRLDADLQFIIGTLKVGGIILFSHNLETPDQIRKLCSAMQAYARMQGQPPLMIAIDQEGGQVARLKEPFTQFPGNAAMQDAADAVYFAQTTATELAAVGINMNLAPVMDVAPREISSIMASRSFGHDPGRVSQLGLTVISHLQQHNIMAVAKHFPGIGRTTADSHLDLPCCEYDLAELESFDLIPFAASIKQAVAGIMLSHVIYEKIDPRWPASLSPRIAQKLLRERMQFAGVSMTDDLDMGAINRHFDIKTSIRQILQAGIDITLICHKGPNIEIAFNEILRHLQGSRETRAMGTASVKRIMALKRKYLTASG